MSGMTIEIYEDEVSSEVRVVCGGLRGHYQSRYQDGDGQQHTAHSPTVDDSQRQTLSDL